MRRRRLDGIRCVSDCNVREKMRPRNIKVIARREEERSSAAARNRYAHRTLHLTTPITGSEGNEGRWPRKEQTQEGTLPSSATNSGRLEGEDGCNCLCRGWTARARPTADFSSSSSSSCPFILSMPPSFVQ